VEARALSESFLAALGLGPADFMKRPGQLSGGMRQRVAIARAALAARSIDASGSFVSLTILDEPLKGLDPATRSSAVRFIKKTFARTAAQSS
ncbi:MAG: hypothetical protein J5950_05125, partial [Clostridia bacterium]|nr:hypothetical protein [Clostridia bacterium]